MSIIKMTNNQLILFFSYIKQVHTQFQLNFRTTKLN